MAASDFSSLLRQPAGQAKKPPVLDAGNYPALVKSYEVDNKNKNKTTYLRVHVGYTGWPEGATPQTNEDGTIIELGKRQGRRDFFLTPDALWRLDEFLRSCGLSLEGRSYEEVFPELTNKTVIASVKQYMNERNNELGNEIDALVGTDG